jgi:hypothetical protein
MITLSSFLQEKEMTAYGVDKRRVLYTKIFSTRVAFPRSEVSCEIMALYIFGKTLWTGNRPSQGPSYTEQREHTYAYMPDARFESVTPVFEQPNTVHDSDDAATNQ